MVQRKCSAMIVANANRALHSKTAQRIAELDGLRGAAVALVVITHCFNLASPPGASKYIARFLTLLCQAKSFAWSGVDLFFVLSGFLIGLGLLKTRSSPDYYRRFYTRRALRILPLYSLFLAFMACCYLFVYPKHQDSMAWPLGHPLPWYSYLTFTANISMALRHTFGAWGLAVLWSLALEEQFYLVAPFLVRHTRNGRLPYVIGAGILSALLLRCFLQLFRDRARLALYVLLPCRMDSLLWGMLAAYAFTTPDLWNAILRRQQTFRLLFYALGVAVFLASFSAKFGIHSPLTTTIGYAMIDLFYLSALILVLIEPRLWLARIMRQAWLRGLGAISYGLYLIHYTVYGLIMACLLGHSGPVTSLREFAVSLFAVAVAVGLASVSWHFFERPVMTSGLSVLFAPLLALNTLQIYSWLVDGGRIMRTSFENARQFLSTAGAAKHQDRRFASDKQMISTCFPACSPDRRLALRAARQTAIRHLPRIGPATPDNQHPNVLLWSFSEFTFMRG